MAPALKYSPPSLAARRTLAFPQSAQHQRFVFTASGWAMKDPMPDHQPFERITALSYQSRYLFRPVRQGLSDQVLANSLQPCKVSLTFTKEELSMPKPGDLTESYIVLGYMPWETIIQSWHFKANKAARSHFGILDPKPNDEIYEDDEEHPPFMVVMSLTDNAATPRYYVLMYPQKGLCMPYRVAQTDKLAIFWRWEFRSNSGNCAGRLYETGQIASTRAESLVRSSCQSLSYALSPPASADRSLANLDDIKQEIKTTIQPHPNDNALAYVSTKVDQDIGDTSSALSSPPPSSTFSPAPSDRLLSMEQREKNVQEAEEDLEHRQRKLEKAAKKFEKKKARLAKKLLEFAHELQGGRKIEEESFPSKNIKTEKRKRAENDAEHGQRVLMKEQKHDQGS